MSRREGKKFIELNLPSDLRQRLQAQTGEMLPLAYLVRQALRQAMDAGADFTAPAQPGAGTPVQLQLTTEERARLERWTKAHNVSEDIAVLSLISAHS